jgi:predicted CDP-diglyceride synthetase/phosphatidate cytidylyltransferase
MEPQQPTLVTRVAGARHRTTALALVLVGIGAVTVVASAVIHLYLWGREDGYRAVPTIGPLFLLQGIVGCVLGVAIIALRRVAVTAVGALYLAMSVGGLLISLHGALFGYPETLDAPYVKLTLTDEIIGLVACLAACALAAREA